MTHSLKKILLFSVLLTAWSTPGQTQNILVKNGQKIVFMGDSITQMGAAPAGYATQVIRGLEANGIKATMICAGVGGNKSDQMLARLDSDVLAQHPDWMTLSCGVNDVWFGLPLDQYKANITQIVEKALVANVKVVILTATVIGENPDEPKNQQMLPYNTFLHQLAREKKCPLADLNADIQAAVLATKGGAQSKRGNVMTLEGIHPNALGHEVMALGVLKALGMDAAQLQKARNSWLSLPGICEAGLKGGLTLRQYEQLDALATKQNRPTSDLIGELAVKTLDSAMK
jgi:lysophospholipase L1-like esterase